MASAADKAATQMKTYVGPGGDFQFRYPAWLIDCKADPNDLSCVSYMPVCDGESYGSIICIAYPKDRVKEQKTFGGAAFVVSMVQNAHDEAACREVSSALPPQLAHQHKETINGVEFWVSGAGGGVAMGHSMDQQVYRAFHNNLCYELGINISAVARTVYDPPEPKSFSQKAVEKPLRQTLRTFQFLK